MSTLLHPSQRTLTAVSIGVLAATLGSGAAFARTTPAGYEYVSPRPDARYVSPGNNIILRTGQILNRGLLNQATIVVTGAVSGLHTGTLDLSDDRETVLFQPDRPFAPGEDVEVRVAPRFRGQAPQPLPATTFHFSIGIAPPAAGAAAVRAAASDVAGDDAGNPPPVARSARPGVAPSDGLPGDEPPGDDVPKITPVVNAGPTTGHLFVAPFRGYLQEPGYLDVLDEYGTPVFMRKLMLGGLDFKPQPNGWITYWTAATPTSRVPRFYVLDSRTAVVDSIAAGNGYTADLHDLRVLPNGHLLLMCYDPETVHMDSIVPGGKPNATVIGLVIQELDLQRRVVFEWRSWDDFAFTDLVDRVITLTAATIDWVHGNAITVDRAGDLVISSRHLNEVTKISRRTGEVLWRFGGRAVNNQFAITGDPRGFSHQHHVRVHDNGNLTLYDNGNDVAPPESRAVEYALDENAKTARLVWEYRHTPSLFGAALGCVQELADGGQMICWGATAGNVKFTQLDATGKTVYEAGFTPSAYNTYRAFKGPWHITRITTDVDHVDFGAVATGAIVTRTVTVTNPGPDSLRINSASTSGDAAFQVAPLAPVTLASGASTTVTVTYRAPVSGAPRGKLYVGNVSPTSILLQEVVLAGETEAATAARRTVAAGMQVSAISDPAKPAATIRFVLPAAAEVEVAVFDVRGRRIATLARGGFAAGEHAATWNSNGFPSGVYFASVRSGEASSTRKFAIVR